MAGPIGGPGAGSPKAPFNAARGVANSRAKPKVLPKTTVDKKSLDQGHLRNIRDALETGFFNAETRQAVDQLLMTVWFDGGILIVIMANAAMIGVELSLSLEGKSTVATKVVENIFLVIYIFELMLRFFATGLTCIKSPWVQFDGFLVLIGVLTEWILEPVLQVSPEGLGPLMVLRTLRMARLLRLLKAARLFQHCKELWTLVRGFINSLLMMLWIAIVLVLTIYVLGCLSIELITKNRLNQTDDVFQENVQKHFRSLPIAMLTLLRFAVLDNTSEIYKPLVEREPWLALFFLAVLMLMSLIFFNLIGAVISSSALEQNTEEMVNQRQEEIENWHEMIQELKAMFIRLDEDESGTLSKEEFLCIHPADMKILCKALGEGKTPLQVFNALDIDHKSELSIEEFFDGVWDEINAAGGLEVKRMEKQVDMVHRRLRDFQEAMAAKMAQITDDLAAIGIGQPCTPTSPGGSRRSVRSAQYSATQPKLANGRAAPKAQEEPKRPHSEGATHRLFSEDVFEELKRIMDDSSQRSRLALEKLEASVAQQGKATGTSRVRGNGSRSASREPPSSTGGKRERGRGVEGRGEGREIATDKHIPSHQLFSGSSTVSSVSGYGFASDVSQKEATDDTEDLTIMHHV